MNILHICTRDSGGAGLCAYKISKELQKIGYNSKMLVLYKTTNDATVKSVFRRRDTCRRLFYAILRKCGLYWGDYNKLVKLTLLNKSPYTSPVTPFDISNDPWVQEADVIHLHWIDDFFNQPLFFKNIKKPIVWTLHDEGMFYGAAHFEDSVQKENDLEVKYRRLKEDMTKNADNLSFVLLSNYFKRKFASSPILAGHKIYVVNNSVNCTAFKLYNQTEARKMLGLDLSKTYFAFLAGTITDPRKGLDKLVEAVYALDNPKYEIIAIGKSYSYRGDKVVTTTGALRDANMISKYLSACNYFVMPSLQEAFAQSPLEAMSCGVPVICFPVSGTEELINDSNGIIADDFSVGSLIKAIKCATKRHYDSDYIRQYVMDNFSPQKIVGQYLQIYDEIVK